ncbi:MAG TPA: helicase-related protein, partial [bacterium]|nr:helicase-related protein [bacterium]
GENYDLMVLDQNFIMLRPREHSAQIPPESRETIERIFKGKSELINTLVCTPTLELGVNIGALDSVLMRNVPPLPANYWQRAGRAGREHRMAVNLTYVRPASHDRAYFADPLKLLNGLINPPRFNLKNELMVRKHIHAVVLTVLFKLGHNNSHLSEYDRNEINHVLNHCFPDQVKQYLFDENGYIRLNRFDLSPFTLVVSKHEKAIVKEIHKVFTQGWPPEDAQVVSSDFLVNAVRNIADELAKVIDILVNRLNWALDQMNRLDETRLKKGTLDPDEDALRYRCDRLVKKLKGIERRQRNSAEGFDETNTYAVLAAEGFLPGYGLETGNVVGSYQAPRFGSNIKDWHLRRALAMALREYVPGNLIYANGHRFFPRFFHLEPVQPMLFQVDVANEAVVEVGMQGTGHASGLSTKTIPAVRMCDVDLPHQSHITDDEEFRFQMPVSVFGYEQSRHGGGRAYHWGLKDVTFRKSVHLRLVNVGAAQLVKDSNRLGYPICTVCGQSRSPLASQADRDQFTSDHKQRCGKDVVDAGFYADVISDVLQISSCKNRTEAYSIAEVLRRGATEILEMELEDLQVITFGKPGSDNVDAVIYDPMPGGSGILDQMKLHWSRVVSEAENIVDNCFSDCDSACVDCLYTFRNAFYHRFLNRKVALACLKEWGDVLTFSHPIPPKLPETDKGEMPVNVAESTMKALLENAGFQPPVCQKPIDLGLPLGTTTPDFFYKDPVDRTEGICIYLDGMSKHIHGNPNTRQKDREIREELRSREYEVFEIPYGDLTDRNAMRLHFYRLGRILMCRSEAIRIKESEDWFQ